MSGSHAIMRYTLIKTNDMKTKEHGLHYKSNTIACACRKLQTLLLCEIKKRKHYKECLHVKRHIGNPDYNSSLG